MPLSEQRRQQLDSIVQRAESEGESEDTIRFIVNDFKGKYEGESTAVRPSAIDKRGRLEKFLSKAQDIAGGINRLAGTQGLAENLGRAVGTRPGEADLRQAVGSGIQGAATIASLGFPVVKGAGLVKTLQRSAQAGLAGGTSGAGKAIEEGRSAPEVARAILGGGLGAATTTGVFEQGAGVVKKGLKTGAETIYNRLVKTPPRQAAAGREEIGSGLLKRDVRGSLNSMGRQVTTIVQSNKKALDDVMAKRGDESVNIQPVIQSLEELRDKLKNTPGETLGGVDEVLDFFKGKQTITLAEAQRLKQNLQAAVNDAFLRRNTTGATQAQKTASQRLRRAIEEAVPEVAPLNKEIEFGIRAGDQLIRTANYSPSKLRIIAELAAGGYGLIANPAVLTAVLAERLATSPTTGSRFARQAYKAGTREIDPRLLAAIQRTISLAAGRNQ